MFNIKASWPYIRALILMTVLEFIFYEIVHEDYSANMLLIWLCVASILTIALVFLNEWLNKKTGLGLGWWIYLGWIFIMGFCLLFIFMIKDWWICHRKKLGVYALGFVLGTLAGLFIVIGVTFHSFEWNAFMRQVWICLLIGGLGSIPVTWTLRKTRVH